jgi:hypothetical protein
MRKDRGEETSMTQVFSTFRVPGFHRWPAAPEPVSYLAARHRHIFHFRISVKVTGQDREVEFITMRNVAEQMVQEHWGVVNTNECEFGTYSCEQIAQTLLGMLKSASHAVASVSVSEDGENGAIVQ